MNENRTLSSLAIQFVIAAAICTLYSLVYGVVRVEFFPGILLLYAPLVTIVNGIFLLKERSVEKLVLFNLAFILLFSCLIIYQSLSRILIAVPFLVFFSYYGVVLTTKPSSNGKLLRFFDFSIVLMLISIFISERNGYYISFSYPMIASTVLSLVAVIASRQKLSEKRRSWFFTLPVSLVVIIAVIVFLSYAAKAGSGIISFWNLIVNASFSIYSFFSQLFSKLPKLSVNAQLENVPDSTESTFNYDGNVFDPLSGVFLFIIAVMGIAVGIYLVFYFLLKLQLIGKRKVKRDRSSSRISRSSVSLLSGIRNALRSIRIEIDSRRFLRRNRNNIVGLYFWMERRLYRTCFHKKTEESAENFLKRIASASSINLTEYIDELNRYFYSADKTELTEISDAAFIRKQVTAILHVKKS